jgi:alanine dehydrogenase
MHKEAGERRDFLPDLVAAVARRVAEVVIEAGMGSGMGLEDEDYRKRDPHIRVGTNAEAFAQDIVITLRAPETEELSLLRPGATLVSMLHFGTRPARVAKLDELGVSAIALDRIVDDGGKRLVVNARSVAWNGLEAAFDALEDTWPPLRQPGGRPVRVLVLGPGAVGRHAVEAATKFGDTERRDAYLARGFPGVIVTAVGRNITDNEAELRPLFPHADLLVDASQRDDPTTPLVPNTWIADLPAHAVVCDLVVDPYLVEAVPPTVRSIEGIPRGNLDKYRFAPGDEGWCDTIPPGIATDERRITVTCYSWPGVRPYECMEVYGAQLSPLLEALLARGGAHALRPDANFHERALYRGSLQSFLEIRSPSVHAGRPRRLNRLNPLDDPGSAERDHQSRP